MTLAEVKSLRSQQRYEEAVKLSRQLLKLQPDDLWQRRSHAWSLYYLIKKQVNAGEKTSAEAFLNEFELLQLPAEDVLIHEKIAYFRKAITSGYLDVQALIKADQFAEALELQLKQETLTSQSIAWTIYYLLKQQTKLPNPDLSLISRALDALISKTQPVYELVDKMILIQLIRIPQSVWNNRQLSNYLEHLGLFNSLESDDFEPANLNGKTIPSLAERLFISYSKALIREKAPKDKIADFITGIVESKLEQFPHMIYVPYFKAKLLLQTGNPEEGMIAFLPFARKKQREFWVWQVLAECHEENPEIFLACLCKALTCKTKPEFLSGIKDRIIPALIQLEEFDWAKTELDSLLALRQKNNWGIRSAHREWVNQSWYQLAISISLSEKYSTLISQAERLLQNQLKPNQSILVVITQINPTKNVFSFATNDLKYGFTSYPEQSPILGEVYELNGHFSDAYFHLSSMTQSNTRRNELTQVRKEVFGKLTIPKGKDFGFVDGVFLSPAQIKDSRLKHGEMIKGVAIYAPIKRDGPMKWKLTDQMKDKLE
jgi:hypothetical protein